jgi:hypothetical protein
LEGESSLWQTGIDGSAALLTHFQAAFLKHGTLACALKKDMVDHNQSKVRELQQPIALIKAVNNQKTAGPSLRQYVGCGFYLSHFFLSDVITLSCLFSQPVQALTITHYMSEGKNI